MRTHIYTCVYSLYSENKLVLTALYIDGIHLDKYNLPVFPNSRFGALVYRQGTDGNLPGLRPKKEEKG